MKDLGVALFVDPKKPGDGFFSKGEESSPCSGVHELSTDTVWITNIRPWDFMQNNFTQIRHLRSANFFRTDVSFLIKECGLEGDLAFAAEFLAETFNRAYGVLCDRADLSLEDCPFGLRQELTSQLVDRGLSVELLNDTSLFEGVRQSIQYNQGRAGSARFPKGSRIHSFTVPRTALASYLCSQPLPSSTGWKKVAFEDGMISVGQANGRSAKTSESYGRMVEAVTEKFFVLDIDVREIDRRYAGFKSFGVGDKTSRKWACLEEIMELSRYAIVDIRGGWACDKVDGLLPTADMPSEFSYSRGVANEIYSLARASNVDKETPNPCAAYLRSVERILLGRAAEAFESKGFCVGSYGTGRINVFLRSSEHKASVELSLSLGLIPPFSLMVDPVQPSKVVLNPKLYYRENLLDDAINVTSFVESVESDWLRMFVVGAALKGDSPFGVMRELDRLLDLPEPRRLKHFESLANAHISDLPQSDAGQSEDEGGSDSGDLVF